MILTLSSLAQTVRAGLGRFADRVIRRGEYSSTRQYMRVAYTAPRQVVLLTALRDEERNVWPVDWHMPVSIEPHRYAVSMEASGYGTEMVRDTGAFVVNFVPASWEETILYCGRHTGREVDKFAERNLETETGETVDAPRLRGAIGYLECQVCSELTVGGRYLEIARVTASDPAEAAPALHHLRGDFETGTDPR